VGRIEGQAAPGRAQKDHRLGFIDHRPSRGHRGVRSRPRSGTPETPCCRGRRWWMERCGWPSKIGDVGPARRQPAGRAGRSRACEELRRNVGIVGASARGCAIWFQVHLDYDPSRPSCSPPRPCRGACWKVGEDLVPRRLCRGASPTERNRSRQHRPVTGSGCVLLSSHQPGALGHAVPTVALGSKAQETRARLTPKAVPIGELAGSLGLKGGWGHGRRGLGQGPRGKLSRQSALRRRRITRGFQELSTRSFKVTVFFIWNLLFRP